MVFGDLMNRLVTRRTFEWLERSRHFGTLSDLRFGRRQLAGGDGIGEAHAVVAAVAKRLVGRVAATAQRDDRAASQSKGCAGGVADLEFALHTEGPVVQRSDFDGHQNGW